MKYAWFLIAFSMTILSVSPIKAESLSVATYEHLEQLDKVFKLKAFVIEALKKENIDVTFQSAPFLRSVDQVQSGQVDGLFPCGSDIPKLFSNIVLIDSPVLYTNLIAVSLKEDNAFSIKNLEKLQGASILNNLGVREFAKKRSLKLLEVASPQQAFELLEKKRIEFILISQDVATVVLDAKPTLREKVQLNTEVLDEARQYFALNKAKLYLAPKIRSAFKRALHDDLAKYPQIKLIANKNFK